MTIYSSLKKNISVLMVLTLVLIIGMPTSVFAKKMQVEIEYTDRDDIKEYIKYNNKKIPFYSLVKEKDIYKVIYKFSNNKENEKQTNKSIKYQKIVKKHYYESVNKISEKIRYEEYNEKYGSMFSGKLELMFIKRIGDHYIAEYSGEIKNS